MKLPIYMDYNATTPVDPRVLEAMLPYYREHFGNPASSHPFGHDALNAVGKARKALADLLGVLPEELIFTSGATEADNMAIFGTAFGFQTKGLHLITQKTEHPAVLEPFRILEAEGFEVTYLPVDGQGRVDPTHVAQAITPRTTLISIMHAHNEIGTLQPIAEIGRIAREKEVAFHTDAAQSFGKVPFPLGRWPVDLASITAHKLYGPKGIGALFVRGEDLRAKMKPLHHGGGQELGLRPGTLNVPGIVGLAAAAELATAELAEETERLKELRMKLHRGLLHFTDAIRLNGHPEERLPGNLHLSFAGLDAHLLLAQVPEVAVSTGSACHSGPGFLSPVLEALGIPREWALGSVRFGLGRFSTEEEVDFAVHKFGRALKNLKQ